MDEPVVTGEIVEGVATEIDKTIVHDNGKISVIQDNGRYKITTDFDPAQHAIWLQKRRHLAMLAASKGLTRSAGDKISDFDAWGLIIEAQAELAVQTDQGSVSTRAAEFVGRATGMLDMSSKSATSEPTIIKADNVSIGSINLIEKLLNVLDK